MQKNETEEEKQESAKKELCAIRGRVTYARGPVCLAEVSARAAAPAKSETDSTTTSASTDSAEIHSATTDLAGAYELLNLQPGIYEITVTPPKGWNYKAEPQTLRLAIGEVKVADFLLEKVVLETIFEGRVFDGDGVPARGARLEGVICGTNLESAVTETDSDGQFIFKNVIPGARFVRVMLSGHAGEIHDFTIEEGQRLSLDVTLKKAAHKIHGTVTNQEGKPFEAIVRLYANGGVSQTKETTKEDGGFEFAVNDGEYGILVQAPSYELVGWNGSVSEDKELVFRLVPIGQVRDAEIDHSG